MRIVVIGTSGAGKTTLARAVARRLDMPRIELDALNWQAWWRDLARHDPEAFAQNVAQAIQGDRWVADGNYRGVRDLLWRKATHLVWLDYERPVIMARVIGRSLLRVILRTELWPGTGNREQWRHLLQPSHPIRWAWSTWRELRRDTEERLGRADFLHLNVLRVRRPADAGWAVESLVAEAALADRLCYGQVPNEEDQEMSAAGADPKVMTVASCSNVRDEHRSHVIVSGSYGGRYNAFNAAKWGVRGVIMNDAGIGKDNAGIVGLEYLDQIGLAAATADAQTCHIGDGDHMLAHGVISHVNRAASALGCKPGQSVRECASLMRSAAVPSAAPPPISDGARFVVRDVPGEPRVICADSVGMLEPGDAGQIAITASHGALSGGRPDNAIPAGIYAVFFSDAGGGMDGAGIARLPDLERKGIVAGTTSADSAPIGDSRALYRDGILSHVNAPARRLGARVGMSLHDFVDILITAAKR
jgi:adenylate kinase family enzyme